MNDLNTDGEATDGEATDGEAKIEYCQDKLSFFLGRLVQHHVKKAVEAKFEAVVLVTDQLEGELDELKAKTNDLTKDEVNYDSILDIVNERLDERDAERNAAEDASEYLRVEDLPDAVRDCFLNGDVTLNVEVS